MRLRGLFALGLALAPLGAAQADEGVLEHGVITALIENDSFSTQDRNYTNGLKLAYVAPWNNNDALTRKLIAMLWPGEVDYSKIRLRSDFGIGQSMFTPDDITVAAPIPGERPYAGWLYAFTGLTVENHDDTYRWIMTSIEIEAGVVGPSAGAKYVQTNFHKLINGQTPRGWDNQLKDEPGLDITVERAIRFKSRAYEHNFAADIVPDFGATAGNIYTQAFVGLTLRAGTDLDRTALPMRIRPSLSGSGSFDYVPGESPFFAWSIFAGVYGRAVARNIFLDGNTFRHSLSVDKKPFVADAQGGFAVRAGRLEVSYTYVLRGEEYYGQHANSRFGAVGVSWHL